MENTCEKLCGRLKPCRNVHCSANPNYVFPKKNKEEKKNV